MKISNEELVKFLIENRTDKNGDIDLSELDFGDRSVDISEMKVGGDLWQVCQEVGGNLWQNYQKVKGKTYN